MSVGARVGRGGGEKGVGGGGEGLIRETLGEVELTEPGDWLQGEGSDSQFLAYSQEHCPLARERWGRNRMGSEQGAE